MNFKFRKINQKEVITCLLLIVVGYMSARLFTRMNAGFRVGGQSVPDYCKSKCLYGAYPYSSKQDICNKVSQANCSNTWYKNTAKGGEDGKTEIGIGCYWNEEGKQCITPGTGFKSASGCPQKKCAETPTPPGKTPPGKTPTPTSKYSCSGSTCISDSKGTYNASDCSDSCGFSCNASNTCISGLSGSGTYDTKDECQKKCSSSIWTSWWMIMIYIVAGLFFILLIGFALSK